MTDYLTTDDLQQLVAMVRAYLPIENETELLAKLEAMGAQAEGRPQLRPRPRLTGVEGGPYGPADGLQVTLTFDYVHRIRLDFELGESVGDVMGKFVQLLDLLRGWARD